MKNALLVTGIGAIVIALGAYFAFSRTTPEPVVQGCTMEAKICPDGTAVGRIGPNCEFAECPVSTSTPTIPPRPTSGTLVGTVTTSPTCPVERMPPDPNCAPKAYKTVITIRDAKGGVVAQSPTDANGAFEFSLPAGTYTVIPKSGEILPRCESEEAVVKAGGRTTLDIDCDSGIR